MTLFELLGDSYKEDMTIEEINNALSSIEKPNVDDYNSTIDKLKTALTNSNKEAADYKKQLRAKLSS